MQAEYDRQQITEVLVDASRWNKFKLTEMHLENVLQFVHIWWWEVQILLKVPIAAGQQETPVLLLLLWPKQQRKEWEGGGTERKRLCGG